MLNRFYSVCVAFVLIVGGFSGYSQDIQLSQFYRADLFLNPAFAGRTHNHRLFAHERIQWPGVAGKYITSMVGFDTYVPQYTSGVGFYFVNDIQGQSNIASNEFNLLYAYDVHFSDQLSARLGLQAASVFRNINYSGLIYPSQLTDDGVVPGGENLDGTNQFYADFSTGGIIYNDKFWFGYSAHHLPRPQQTFIVGDSRLPMKHTFTFGYKIELGGINPFAFSGYVKPFYMFPMVHYKFQGKSDQLDLGMHGMNDQLMFGVWYRGIPVKRYDKGLQNNESLIFMVGWQFKHLSLSYSYDFITSKLGPATPRGSHEINITYLFFKDKKPGLLTKLPCPDFQNVMKMRRKTMSSY